MAERLAIIELESGARLYLYERQIWKFIPVEIIEEGLHRAKAIHRAQLRQRRASTATAQQQRDIDSRLMRALKKGAW